MGKNHQVKYLNLTYDDEITNLFLHHNQKPMTSLNKFRKYFSEMFSDPFKCTLNWFILPHVQNWYKFFDFLLKKRRNKNQKYQQSLYIYAIQTLQEEKYK